MMERFKRTLLPLFWMIPISLMAMDCGIKDHPCDKILSIYSLAAYVGAIDNLNFPAELLDMEQYNCSWIANDQDPSCLQSPAYKKLHSDLDQIRASVNGITELREVLK